MTRILAALTHKKSLRILGINSGTSADGLDFALVQIDFPASGSFPRVTYLCGYSKSFPKKLRQQILAIADHPDPALSAILSLDSALGDFIGVSAQAILRKIEKLGLSVDAICSHGQTVRHLPRKLKVNGKITSATCQLGSLERIATMTQKVVVGDVRQGDIATGGEGAPITVAAVKFLFGSSRESRLIVNIGGISNYFWLPSGDSWNGIEAADCGPGNVLIDQLALRLFGHLYDRNGSLARRGTVSEELLRWSVARTKKSSRSTGREAYGPKLIDEFLAKGRSLSLGKHDLIATATALTAEVIAPHVARCARLSKGKLRLSLTGGGAKNSFLVGRIMAICVSENLKKSGSVRTKISTGTIDELGIPSQMVESASYAIMGGAVLAGYPLPTRWDANGKVAAIGYPGKIVQPSKRVSARHQRS